MLDALSTFHADDAALRLTDGSVYRIRPSDSADRGLLIRCFAGLSPESRRLRFFADKRGLTEEDLNRFCGADGRDHIALVAVRAGAAGQEAEPIGFARCLRLAPGGDVAELSIATVDRVQGQGVGSALLARLVDAARSQGIRRFWFQVLAENLGMRRLAQRLGGVASWSGGGILEYDCPLPEPSPHAASSGGTAHSLSRDPTSWPWYLDPGIWAEPWTRSWMAHLDSCLAAIQAANEDFVHWLEWDDSPTGRGRRDAA